LEKFLFPHKTVFFSPEKPPQKKTRNLGWGKESVGGNPVKKDKKKTPPRPGLGEPIKFFLPRPKIKRKIFWFIPMGKKETPRFFFSQNFFSARKNLNRETIGKAQRFPPWGGGVFWGPFQRKITKRPPKFFLLNQKLKSFFLKSKVEKTFFPQSPLVFFPGFF